MLKHFKWGCIVLVGLTLFCSLSQATAKKSSPDFSQWTIQGGIPKLLTSAPQVDPYNNRISILVNSMKTGKTLYSRFPASLLTPASVQKLFTAVAALLYLKPDFEFHTSLLSNGNIQDHVLKGNLILRFSGDPTLTSNDIKSMIEKLKNLGVRQISGQVYIDNSVYTHIPYPPGCIWDDLSYSYGAPLGAIIIDKNKFVIRFLPANTYDRKPTLQDNLPKGVIHIINLMTTSKNYSKHCPVTIYSNDHNQYRVAGCLVKSWGPQARSLAIRNMTQYAQILLGNLLKQSGIQYRSTVKIHPANPKAHVLIDHKSALLKKIIIKMLKDSDNLATNTLLLKLGERYYHRQGDWQNGLHALKAILKPTGIDFKKSLINDGAGLSRYNLVTATQIAKLLSFAYHDKLINKPLLTALPIAGKDGTLQYRMRFEKSERIIAKTGSMTGVSALAGYVFTKNNGPVSFVIIVNGFIGKRRPFVYLENKICKLLLYAKRNP